MRVLLLAVILLLLCAVFLLLWWGDEGDPVDSGERPQAEPVGVVPAAPTQVTTPPRVTTAPPRVTTAPAVIPPPGMVEVPAGRALIGTPMERLRDELRLEERSEAIQRDFAFETPRHEVEMERFFLDRCEVTNAQYLAFMEDTARTTIGTPVEEAPDLVAVAGSVVGRPKERWPGDDHAWRQLLWMNRDVLLAVFKERVVRGDDGRVDDARTAQALQTAALPPGVPLTFWTRKPPHTWTAGVPLEAQLDMPVTSVSYDDAEAFAEWAGKHIPTEVEWAYAARGPEGFIYPWGNEWFADASHANWGGRIIGENLPEELRTKLGPSWTYKPVLLPVESLPLGRSWCGAYEMLGNAGEWTSSWFEAYPGNAADHRFHGGYVKVIRGATFIDQDPLVLRLAARNFLGAGTRRAPPRPENRFDYIGFRCAWSLGPGRNRHEAIARRVAEGGVLEKHHLDLDRHASAVCDAFLTEGDAHVHHVTVAGRSHALVVIPLKRVPACADATRVASLDVLRRSSHDRPYPLAVLHTDMPLVHLGVPEGQRRRRGSTGDVGEAGTWILVVWQGELALATPDLSVTARLLGGELSSRIAEGPAKEQPDLARTVLHWRPERPSAGFRVESELYGAEPRLADVNAGARRVVLVADVVLSFDVQTFPAFSDWRVHADE